MQQRVTPKSLIAENKRRDYGRVRNHLKVILVRTLGLFVTIIRIAQWIDQKG